MDLMPIIGAFAMLLAFCAGFVLLVIQPIWAIVDIAASPWSTAVKATLIVLTLVLLGPLLTFFYAVFATKSPGLRHTTLAVTGLFVLSIGAVFTAAALAPPDPGSGAAPPAVANVISPD